MRAPIAKQTKTYDFKVGEKVTNVLKPGEYFEIEALLDNNFTRCYFLNENLGRVERVLNSSNKKRSKIPTYDTILIRRKNLKRI